MNVRKKFTRVTEDFLCGKCSFHVEGTGYTNHCPECLWSKHVDINPGDRAADCLGLMEPMRVEKTKGEYSLLHRCCVCGYLKKNKLAKNDNMNVVLAIMKRFAENA